VEKYMPLIGEVIAFTGLSAPSGFLDCDGVPVSRTTYNFLRTVLGGQILGTRTNGSATVTGLATTAGIRVGCPVEASGFPAGTVVMGILSSTSVSLSNVASGSGATLFTFWPWGNGDGSTTMNLPDLRRKAIMGAYGSQVGSIATGIGDTGGTEQVTLATGEIPGHTHNFGSISGGTAAVPVTGGPFTAAGSTYTTTSTGGGGAHENFQPSTVVRWLIRVL